MIAALALISVLSQSGAQDDEQTRAHIRDLVDRLGEEDVSIRDAAERSLLALAVRFVPDIAKAGEGKTDAEVKARLARILVPAPWAKVLRGTLDDARKTIAKLANPRHPERAATIEKALADLRNQPAEELSPSFQALFGSPEPGIRDFASRGLARFPPADPSAIVSAAIEAFCDGKPGWQPAAYLLARFGARDQAERVAAAMKERPELFAAELRILERTGAPAEDALLGLLQNGHSKGDEIAETLKWVGTEKSIPAVREHIEKRTRSPDIARDLVPRTLRGPLWARERLAEEKAHRSDHFIVEWMDVAALGGTGLRDDVLAWLKDPKVRLGDRKRLLPLLGAVGRLEDGALLAESLEDNRLVDEAAQALDMMGDPTHAGALMEAFKRTDIAIWDHFLLSLPTDNMEDGIVEILSDHMGYLGKIDIACHLASRRLTPAIREALYNGLLKAELSGDATWALLQDVKEEDKSRIDELRRSKHSRTRVSGLLLALRLGDAAAAPELAAMAPLTDLKYRLESAPLLEWAEPAGKPWMDAVTARWREKPDWVDGTIWLASQGLKEAQERLRAGLDGLEPYFVLPRAERALAAIGDPEGLTRFMKRMIESQHLSADNRRCIAAVSPQLRDELRKAMGTPGEALRRPGLVLLAALVDLPEGISMYLQIVGRDQTGLGVFDEDPYTAPCALALGHLKIGEASIELRRLLRSCNAANRAAAALALADIGDRDCLPLLIRLADDPWEVPPPREIRAGSVDRMFPVRRVWHSAMEAIEKLTGIKTEGATVAERREFWRAWYAKNRDGWK